ncbi:hypothetical protein COK18_03565 [Bacillus cereus]|nr:hypothetical protein COK18_03565 [Bacillus cereus]
MFFIAKKFIFIVFGATCFVKLDGHGVPPTLREFRTLRNHAVSFFNISINTLKYKNNLLYFRVP